MGGKLTAADVEGAGQGMHFDGDGLYLQVSGPQSKSWIYRYTLRGKACWYGLGSTRDVSLANARKKRDKARVQVREGVDLVAERKLAKAARKVSDNEITFKVAAESYIKAHESGWRSAKHAAQWASTLKMYAYPILGELSLDAIDRSHVIRVLEPLWLEKPETARRLRGRMEVILDWAIARGERTAAENPASRHGPLLKGLPKQTRSKGHHEALPYDRIGAFMQSLRNREGIAALALEFTILTAARTGEVLGAKWNEIDSAGLVWSVPAERMKGGREHRVPLPAAAIAVLERMRAMGQKSEFIFPNVSRGHPLSNMAMLKMLERMGHPELTVHGFRSTFRDWAEERTNFPREVKEAALAHTIKDKTEAAYRRGDLFDKRRRLMDAWAEFCARLGDENKIIPLSKAVR
jgi:integrase